MIIGIGIIVFIISYYVSYSYFNKDNDTNEYNVQIIIGSLIASILITCVSIYLYINYMPKKSELLKEDFYN